MNIEDFEKAKKLETEIENIKEVISMLEMFTVYLKENWSEDDRWREVQENKVKQRHSRCNDAELKG